MALTHMMTEDANDFHFTSAANLYGDWLKYGVPYAYFSWKFQSWRTDALTLALIVGGGTSTNNRVHMKT